MYYELYIDVLFLENFMMDSFLLLSVMKIEKHTVSHLRVLGAALLGAGLTCVTIILNIPVVLKYIFLYLLITFLMVSVGFALKNIILVLKSAVLLYIIAILYGGILNLLRPFVRNMSLFYGTGAIAYLSVNLIWKMIGECRKQQRNVYRVTIFTSKGTFQLRALEDTGNHLTDPVSKEAVSVIDQKTAEMIWGICEDIHNISNVDLEILKEEGIRYIVCRTIAGERMMPLKRAEKMIVHQKHEQEITAPLIGICKEPVSERQLYQMILNSDILGGAGNVSENNDTTEI